MTRRNFIGGMSAFGCIGFGSAFSAPSDFALRAKGNLRFGVVSDPHVSLSLKDGKSFDGRLASFGKWLERFRDARVDAVVIPGDLASFAAMRELHAVMEQWRRVFPKDSLPDGGRVERVFILGNHDWEGWRYNKFAETFFPDPDARKQAFLPFDLETNWRDAFGEDFRQFCVKTVKGYDFIQAHWIGLPDRRTCRGRDEDCMKGIGEFYAAYRPDPSKPFFHVQHPSPKGTCFGKWAWGRDTGESTKALAAFPNAFVLCGHSHYPIADERSIWQGAFTVVNCGTCSSPSRRIPAAGDGSDVSEKDADVHVTVNAGKGKPLGQRVGLVLDVYDREIRVTRLCEGCQQPLAEDWVVPLGTPRETPYAFETRKAASAAPMFPPDAKLTVSFSEKDGMSVLRVAFPKADARPLARAMEYVLTLTASDGQKRRVRLLAPGAYMMPDDSTAKADPDYEVPLAEGESVVRAEVCAADFFGNLGNTLKLRG